MSEKGDGFFQEVNVLHLVQEIGTKSKATQAILLSELEKAIPDPKEYARIRKILLDEINGLTRAFVKHTFGNIEFLIK